MDIDSDDELNDSECSSDDIISDEDFAQEIQGVRPKNKKMPDKRPNPNLKLVYMAYRQSDKSDSG